MQQVEIAFGTVYDIKLISKHSRLAGKKTMYEYQKRSNSATLTRVQAYQKKQAQETENSSFGEPIPAINPEPASTNTKKRPLPSQMLRASIARMEEARSKQNDSLESGTQADTALYQPMQQERSI